MKSREISRSKIGPFSLACTDPYIGIGWENQSISLVTFSPFNQTLVNSVVISVVISVIPVISVNRLPPLRPKINHNKFKTKFN